MGWTSTFHVGHPWVLNDTVKAWMCHQNAKCIFSFYILCLVYTVQPLDNLNVSKCPTSNSDFYNSFPVMQQLQLKLPLCSRKHFQMCNHELGMKRKHSLLGLSNVPHQMHHLNQYRHYNRAGVSGPWSTVVPLCTISSTCSESGSWVDRSNSRTLDSSISTCNASCSLLACSACNGLL